MAQSTSPAYDSTFLQPIPSSGPQPTVSKIDFAAQGIPQYASAYAVVIDNLFTADECKKLVELASEANNNAWERALVNIGGGKQAYYPDIRNCDRIIYDDAELASRIFERTKAVIPEILTVTSKPITLKSGRQSKPTTRVATSLNERLRFLRYGPGEFFEKHADGRFSRERSDGSGEEFSLYTVHLYLNEGDGAEDGEKLIGGSTSFFTPWQYPDEKEIQVKPKTGRVLVFQQAGLLHSGEEVLQGLKMTMRTEIMYQVKQEDKPKQISREDRQARFECLYKNDKAPGISI